MNNQFFHDLDLIKGDTQQWQAYESETNTVVIAGPGSGKTRVLALKAVTLARASIHPPQGLALISYSRETVRELKKRLKLYNYTPGSRDFIGTIHSFSLLHVIKPFGHLFPEYGIKYPLKLLPDEVEQQIYNATLAELGVERKYVSTAEINKQRTLSRAGKSGVKIYLSDLVARAAIIFEKKVLETEYLDYTALINFSAQMIQDQEFVRRSLRSRFPWLLIDEYQDLGKSLHEIVLELTLNAGIKLFAVGDMNQSIYGFTGGYPAFLEELTNNDDVKTIQLMSNYRSSQPIIVASLETLIPLPPVPDYISKLRADELPDFTFITCTAEMAPQYRVISEKVIPKLIANGVPYNEIGIILSSNEQVKAMALQLSKKNIPFYISKWKFDSSNVVVWLQDCASWCTVPYSQSFDELFKFWKNLLTTHKDDRRFLSDIDLKVAFHRILSASKSKDAVHEWLGHMISRLGLADLLADSAIYPKEIKNLETLTDEAKNHNLRGAKLLRFAYLGSPDNEVTITTRHSAKGLEFEVVILPGMEDGNFPDYRIPVKSEAMNEAQRVCYVCVSRAKQSCVLLRSESNTMPWGKVKYYRSSPFWDKLYEKFAHDENVFTDRDYT